MRAYDIYRRVVDVSENERLSEANERVFWYKNECVNNTVQSTLHAEICLFYTYWDVHAQQDFHCSFGKCQVMFLSRLSASTLSLLQKPSVNIFRTECLSRHHSTEDTKSSTWHEIISLTLNALLISFQSRRTGARIVAMSSIKRSLINPGLVWNTYQFD